MIHCAPSWMLLSTPVDDLCPECQVHLRTANGQVFCLPCWERRTTLLHENASRALAALRRRDDELLESWENDDTGGYRFNEDKAMIAADLGEAMRFKWAAAVYEMTGKRLTGPTPC